MEPAVELNHVYWELATALGYKQSKEGVFTVDPEKLLEHAVETLKAK